MSKKYPNIIYKYRDWGDTNHKKLLTHNELYVPSVNQINDPFDCLIKYDYSFLEKEGLSLRAVNMLFGQFGNELVKLGYDYHSLIGKEDNDTLLELIELKKKYDDIFIENRKKHLGVISFSERWDSVLMWSYYSNSHKGFCIGFDTEKLIGLKRFENGNKVLYGSTYPNVDPFDEDINNIIKVFYNKSIDWVHEKEYRMTKLFGFDKNKARFENQKKIYFNDDFIKEIILGLNISAEHQDDIIKTCEKRNLPVFKIHEKPYSFELTKEQIH